MVFENESWLLDVGDEIINKEATAGRAALNEIEWAIYCFWVVDYSVRSSGSLDAIEDIYPEALSELNNFAIKNNCIQLSLISDPKHTKDEDHYCDELFYELFESACNEIWILHAQ